MLLTSTPLVVEAVTVAVVCWAASSTTVVAVGVRAGEGLAEGVEMEAGEALAAEDQ